MGKSKNLSFINYLILAGTMAIVFCAGVHGQKKENFKSIKIGKQEWMLENLDVSHFRNGDPIPEARTAREWQKAGEQGRPAWCYYENKRKNGRKYGKLYNWYAVSDPRGLAPEGWHIPDRDEYIELMEQLGGHYAAGTKMKSASGWACGKNGTNESGFTGLPAGIRTPEGDFKYLGQYGYWWTTTEFNELYAYYRYAYWNSGRLFSYVNYFKESGFSVRCLTESFAQEDVSYLKPPRIIKNPDTTLKHSAKSRMKNSIASLAISKNGRLWATWYAGITGGENKNNYVVVATSGDDGKTWEDVLAIDPDGEGPVRAFDPQAWVDPTGKLWIFWAQQIQPARATTSGVWAVTTRDPDAENPEWSEPKRLVDGVMLNKPVVLSDGDWVLPVSFWHFKEASAKIVVSANRGKTWHIRGAADVPGNVRNHDEHMIVERKDGSLWMLIRTRYGIGESLSMDRGLTWGPVTPSKIENPTSRFFISRLNSGNILLVKNGPVDVRTKRTLLTAYISKDEGHTWTGGLLLDERQHVSYPDGQQAQDGTIYIIYDRRSHQQVLLAKFKEEDVISGNPDSETVCLRMLVSRGEASPKSFIME